MKSRRRYFHIYNKTTIAQFFGKILKCARYQMSYQKNFPRPKINKDEIKKRLVQWFTYHSYVHTLTIYKDNHVFDHGSSYGNIIFTTCTISFHENLLARSTSWQAKPQILCFWSSYDKIEAKSRKNFPRHVKVGGWYKNILITVDISHM